MPITSINNGNALVPLSRNWTHQAVVSQAMILTGTLDNEDNVFVTNVRNHINMHIGHLVDMLNQQSSPYYGIYAKGGLDTPAHPSGVEYITDMTSAGRINWHSIKRVTLASKTPTTVNNFGNLANWDISRITQQSNNLNSQHAQTIAWCHHGNELLVYTGLSITTPNITATAQVYDASDYDFILWGYRQPMVDNLGAVGAGGTSWTLNVDLPDKYIKLLIDMTCKSIIQQRNGHIPNELDASINQGLTQLSQNLQTAVALEQQSFAQRKTGQPQRIAGEL